MFDSNYKDFLRELDLVQNKEIYARITSLSFNELPIEVIEGCITGGSINIDGASAIRRSCSLTMSAPEFKYNKYNWSLNNKIKLEIGIRNEINSKYPDIIWFNQGIYILTTFNQSNSVNSQSISLSGKDKMCLLNGEVGGTIESQVDFGTIKEEDINGVWTIRKIPIEEIIKNAVHTYAGEPYHNIIINDLAEYGLELLEYRYDVPLYLYRKNDKGTGGEDSNIIFYNMMIENDHLTLYTKSGSVYTEIKLKDLDSTMLDNLVESLIPGDKDIKPQPVYSKKNSNADYIFAKVEYGQTAGYKMTDLTYAGDLIANAGDSITSVLDKIKNMLVEFEYFYDLDGRFVFQKKKSFLATMWSPLATDDESQVYVEQSLDLSLQNAYRFNNHQLITAFNNSANLLDIRNDYSIWGETTGISGAPIPIHMRYAIDTKPYSYTQISTNDESAKAQIDAYNKRYNTNMSGNDNPKTFTASDWCDWREVIYQMALDYYKFNFLDDFEVRLAAANPQYPTGQTGYERYYIDLQGFWRDLYYPDLNLEIKRIESELADWQTKLNGFLDKIKDITDEWGVVGDWIASLLEPWYQQRDEAQTKIEELEERLKRYRKELKEYYYYDLDDQGNVTYDYTDIDGQGTPDPKVYWHRDVYVSPERINFWFDFLDTEGQLEEYSVRNIGIRSKVVNESGIKSIYFRRVPAVVFTESLNTTLKIPSYKYLQIPKNQIDEMFSISAQGKSAKEKLDELLYTHGYCSENVTITALPIYYLDVNTRIYVNDNDSNVNGDYIVNKISIPLTYNGTMSITANKAAKDILN